MKALPKAASRERPAVAIVKIFLKVRIIFGFCLTGDQNFDLWISFLTPNESKVGSRQTLSAALQFDRAKFRSVELVRAAGDACQAVAAVGVQCRRCRSRHTHEPPTIIDLTLLSDATSLPVRGDVVVLVSPSCEDKQGVWKTKEGERRTF